MPDRRLPLRAALAGIGGVAVFAHVLPAFGDTYVDAGIRDGLHVVGFAAIAFVVFELTSGSPARRALAGLGAAILLGVVAESVQEVVGRHLDAADLLRDAAGAAIAVTARLLWSGSVRRRAGSPSRTALCALSLATASTAFAPLLYWLAVYAAFQIRLPVVAEFSDPLDDGLINSVNSTVVSARDADVLEVALEQNGSTGIMLELVAKDWSAYRTVVLEVAITGAEDARVSVFLHDGRHEGYRSRHDIGDLPVGPALTELRFPLVDVNPVEGRPMLRTDRIERILVLGRFRGGTATLRLDRIWLE